MGRALEQWIKQPAPLAPEISAMLNLIVAASRVEQELENVMEPYGLTRRQYNVMRILRGAHPEGHPRSEIAARMVDRAPDITRLLDRIIDLGYAKRIRGTKDKRESIAKLTPKGLTALKKLDPLVSNYIQNEFGGLYNKKELKLLSELCERTYREQSKTKKPLKP